MTDTGLKKISIILVTCILVAVIGVCFIFVIRNTPQTLNTQKNATSVIAELYKNKNKYIGDASADGKILRLLGSIDGTVSMGIELQTENEPYILIRKFRGKPTDITQAENQAAIILALIDNAGSVEYVFDKETYSYKRSDVEKKYNIVLSKQSKDFKTFEKFYKKVFNDYKMGKILRILAGTNVENPADNVVVISDEKLKQKGNIEVFEKDAGKGQVSALSVIRYTAEGDPIVTAVYYDGKRFYLLEDDSRDKFRGNGEAYTQHKFEYLKIFEENGYRHYYLVNDKNVTYDELFKGMLSSRYGDYIPNYPLASYEI